MRNDWAWKTWNEKYFAAYSANIAPLFAGGQAQVKKYLAGKKLLYYAEGAEAIVSSVQDRKSKLISFFTNGRVEASTNVRDVQVMYMLGHLPMLLHDNPEKVLVIGTGSGMTLGAVSVYPTVERITLAEIEPKVLGVAETFSAWNHNVLQNNKLDIVFNDGRNYLLTTRQKFDVITADPIHPSWRGSGYLYTDEYFHLVSSRLNPGGIACQWLPLYQMSVEDIKSTVKTFSNNFKYTMLWMTLTDVELVGSNTPIRIDEKQIRKRMKIPEVASDMNLSFMGPTTDLLTYFLMGNNNARQFSKNAILNTDNNVFLEYSSPQNIGSISTEYEGMFSLLKYRESIESYMVPLNDQEAQKKRDEKLAQWQDFSDTVDQAHIMRLGMISGAEKYTAQDLQSLKNKMQAVPDLGLWKILKLTLFGSPKIQ